MCKKLIYLVSFMLILSIFSSVQADTITIGSDADTYIRDDVVRGDLEFMDIRGGGVDFGGYLRFDLAVVNVLTVESATLTLTVSGGASRNDVCNNGRFSLYGLDNVAGNTPQDWDETVLTEGNIGVEWTTNNGDPLINVTDLDDDVPGITEDIVQVGANYWDPGSTTVTITGDALVSFIQSRVDDNGLVTFILRDDDGSDRGYGLATKENATEDYRPRLELTAVIGARTSATTPNPANETQDVIRDVILSWTPGEFADKHDIYIGTDFNDVYSATPTDDPAGVYLGRVESNFYPDAGALRLDFNQTYYWRIDEVNAPPDSTVFKGPVWSFTVEPLAIPIPGESISATASSYTENQGPENTVNGSGLDDNDLHSTESGAMWLSSSIGAQPTWIQYELDKLYKLHEMWVWNSNTEFESLIGFGLKDVTIEYSANGTDWTELGGVPEFAQAPGTSDYAHDTTVDFSGAAAKYVKITANSHWGSLAQYSLSEVRLFYIPVQAREPSPDTGATDVDVDVVLGWRAGREAGKHDVYLSSDEQAVRDGTAPVNTVTEASYSTPLDVDSTYYWRVDEVNDVEIPTTWQGEIWSFTTPESLVVDDFEDYNNWEPDRIFDTWIDGWGITTNGAEVGYANPDFLAGEHHVETTTVYGGEQSGPIFYDKFSEVELPLSPAQDWTEHGVTTLVLYFHGDPSNSVEQMYVKVNGSKVVYDGDPFDITKPIWKQWSIDLALFGVDLQSVTKLSIGFGDEANITAGGPGVVLIDEIVLAASAPAVPSEEVWVEAEANNSITAPMMIYNDPSASGGQYVSTETGTADEGTAPPYPNGTVSIPFTVEGGTYTARFRIGFPGSDDSCWVRIQDATITSPVHSSGWIHFNDIPTGDYWHWSQEVKSEDESGEPPVEFTLSAGTHNLEISYRGADLRIDAIVFSKID